jgi:hypothetical protein
MLNRYIMSKSKSFHSHLFRYGVCFLVMELCCGGLIYLKEIAVYIITVQWLATDRVVTFVVTCSTGKFYILIDDYIDWNVQWFVNNSLLAIRIERICIITVSTPPRFLCRNQNYKIKCVNTDFSFCIPCIVLMLQSLCLYALIKLFLFNFLMYINTLWVLKVSVFEENVYDI